MKILSNPDFAKFSKKTAVTVYLMTAVKAGVRPLFILHDKNNKDEDAKKYTAAKEVLYQVLCFIMALLLMKGSERLGFSLAEKKLANIDKFKNIKKFNEIPVFNNIKKMKDFEKLHLDEAFAEKSNLAVEEKEAMHIVNGGKEAGSFVASIVGLTLLAPMISHEILHPIMHAIGMGKKHHEKNVGKPNEIFLADAKVPVEDKKANKLNASA